MDPEETRIYTVVLITSVTLGVIIAYFVVSIIRQQRRNLELQKAAIRAELNAMEKERARIAADLHDELGPILSVIKFTIDNVETTNESDLEQLEKASSHLDDMIAKLREIANNLMPGALRRKGLIKAVGEFADQASAASGLSILFDDIDEISLPADISIHVFRSIQEIVHNCIKHAEATELEIKLMKDKRKLTLLCRDNGKGFDYKLATTNSTGMGLKSLKHRTELMDGTLVVESKPGRGAAFLIEIPVEEL
jgi:signal transduction histidine kinase